MEQNKINSLTNSDIGSYHWFITLLSHMKHIGEFIAKHKENTKPELLEAWGDNIVKTIDHLIECLTPNAGKLDMAVFQHGENDILKNLNIHLNAIIKILKNGLVVDDKTLSSSVSGADTIVVDKQIISYPMSEVSKIIKLMTGNPLDNL